MFSRTYNKSDSVIRNDLSLDLNFSVFVSYRMISGKQFHTFGPARLNALSPYEVFVLTSTSNLVRCDEITSLFFREEGASAHRHLCTIKQILKIILSRIRSQCALSYSSDTEDRLYFEIPNTNLTAPF